MIIVILFVIPPLDVIASWMVLHTVINVGMVVVLLIVMVAVRVQKDVGIQPQQIIIHQHHVSALIVVKLVLIINGELVHNLVKETVVVVNLVEVTLRMVATAGFLACG
jgi:hypothetical protein